MTTDTVIAITPLTILEFNESHLKHIRTAPVAVDPGEAFLQIIELGHEVDGQPLEEPALLVVCKASATDLFGFWYLGAQLDEVNELIDDCMMMSPEQWRVYLSGQQVHSARAMGVSSKVSGFGELLALYHRITG